MNNDEITQLWEQESLNSFNTRSATICRIMNKNVTEGNPTVNVEYCGACDYGGHCLALGKTIRKITPNAIINCKRGRQGSFEVVVNDTLIYSKLQTMALPDYDEVSEVVNDVSQGSEPRQIKRQQPINCAIS